MLLAWFYYYLFYLNTFFLFLGKRNLHCMRWRYLESLQRFLGRTALQFRREFHERNVMSVRHQSYLFEARELIEQHRQHHFVRFLRQIGQEQNLIRWLFGCAGILYATRFSVGRRFLFLFTVRRNKTKINYLENVNDKKKTRTVFLRPMAPVLVV